MQEQNYQIQQLQNRKYRQISDRKVEYGDSRYKNTDSVSHRVPPKFKIYTIKLKLLSNFMKKKKTNILPVLRAVCLK